MLLSDLDETILPDPVAKSGARDRAEIVFWSVDLAPPGQVDAPDVTDRRVARNVPCYRERIAINKRTCTPKKTSCLPKFAQFHLESAGDS
jgi:hypothetical protein